MTDTTHAETTADGPTAYDHLRSTDPEDDDAVYRVVGTSSDSVTLLRVSEADGRRANTGEVITVPTDALDAFETVDNPDGTEPLGAKVTGAFRGAYWSLRGVLTTLVANPRKSVAALALFVAGRFGGDFVPLSDGFLSFLALVGLLGLAAVGTGRL